MDFKNTVIVMTTNLGTRDIAKGQSLGFATGGDTKTGYERMKNKVIDELKRHFRPEFLNRVDDMIVFPQLTEPEIVQIVDLMVAKLDVRLKDKDMGMELTPAAKALLAKKGYDPVLGARPLRRTIQREIEDMLSEKILYGELTAGEIVVVDTEGTGRDEAFTFTGAARAEVDALPLSDVRDGDVPNLDIPNLDIPGAGIQDSDVPDSDIQDSDVPDSDVPDSDIPDDVQHADVQKSGSQGTDLPDTVTTPDAPDAK